MKMGYPCRCAQIAVVAKKYRAKGVIALVICITTAISAEVDAAVDHEEAFSIIALCIKSCSCTSHIGGKLSPLMTIGATQASAILKITVFSIAPQQSSHNLSNVKISEEVKVKAQSSTQREKESKKQ